MSIIEEMGGWGRGGGLRAGQADGPRSPPAPEHHGLRSVDHRLRLFLDVEVFSEAQEEFQCCLKVCASPALPSAPTDQGTRLFVPQQTCPSSRSEPLGLGPGSCSVRLCVPPLYSGLCCLPSTMGRMWSPCLRPAWHGPWHSGNRDSAITVNAWRYEASLWSS